MPSSSSLRFSLIGLLYVSQAVPLGFFIVAMPAILRHQGLSLEYVGLLSAIALPWLIKFLWAPLLDRFGSTRRGHFRSWILPLQSASVLCVAAIAFIDLQTQLALLVVVGALFMLLAATQDIATDGLAVRALRPAERGPGNGIQVGGYYLGQVLGGGAVLIVFNRFGWTTSVLAMAAVLALPLIPAARFKEEPFIQQNRKLDFGAIHRLFRREEGGSWLLILLLYRAGETMAVTMITPMLVDRGLSLARIGVLMGIAGSIASLSGAMVGGALIKPLGRKNSLVLFSALQALALFGLALVAMRTTPMSMLYVPILTSAFSGGMATAALYTHMMDRSSQRTAATDFTVQQSVCAVGPLVGASFSGVSAAAVGYGGHFVACALLNLLCVGIVIGWVSKRLPDRDGLELSI